MTTINHLVHQNNTWYPQQCCPIQSTPTASSSFRKEGRPCASCNRNIRWILSKKKRRMNTKLLWLLLLVAFQRWVRSHLSPRQYSISSITPLPLKHSKHFTNVFNIQERRRRQTEKKSKKMYIPWITQREVWLNKEARKHRGPQKDSQEVFKLDHAELE